MRLEGRARLGALLNHLYVLIPVLDDEKHYWVGEDEITKLLSHGEGWLEAHPEKELIAQRYLKHRRSLAEAALARLAPETQEEAAAPERADAPEEALERPIRLNDERMDAVVDVLRASGAKLIADLGCGEGKLLARLVRERFAERLIGTDASARELERAARRLKLHESGGPPEGRVTSCMGLSPTATSASPVSMRLLWWRSSSISTAIGCPRCSASYSARRVPRPWS